MPIQPYKAPLSSSGSAQAAAGRPVSLAWPPARLATLMHPAACRTFSGQTLAWLGEAPAGYRAALRRTGEVRQSEPVRRPSYIQPSTSRGLINSAPSNKKPLQPHCYPACGQLVSSKASGPDGPLNPGERCCHVLHLLAFLSECFLWGSVPVSEVVGM